MKKIIYITVLFLMIFTSFISANKNTGKIKITTTDYAPGPESTFTIEGKSEMAVYNAFRKKYPDIAPEGVPMGLQMEGLANEASLFMSIAGKTAPDVIHVNGRLSGTYIQRSFLHPLDEFINKDITAEQAKANGTFDPNIMYKDELEQRVLPQMMDVVYQLGPDGKKHFYFLPNTFLVRVLIYNKTIFQRAGLDPEKDIPHTWEDLWRIGQKIHDPDNNTFGMLIDSGEGASWIALPFFLSMGAKVVEQDPLTGKWQAVFNNRQALEAADYYIRLVQAPWKHPRTGKTEYGIGRSRSDIWDQWKKGHVGMVMLYIDHILINKDATISAHNPENIGIVPVPKSPEGKRITEMHLRGQGICATTKDKKKIDAAWKFIRFIGSPEAKKMITRVFVENGYGSYIAPKMLKKFGFDEYIPSVPKQWAQTLEYSIKHSVPEPYGKNCQAYISRMSKPLQTAFAEDLAKNPDKGARMKRLKSLFDKAVKDVNEKMLGEIPPEVMRTRRIVSFIVATFIFIMFVFLFIYIGKAFSPENFQAVTKKQGLGTLIRKFKVAYFLLAPAVLLILVFNYYPLLRGILISFQDYRVTGGSTFVGIDNFAAVLYDKIFWLSLFRTFQYALLYLGFVFVPPIILAILLSEIPIGKIAFRLIFYLPAVVSGLIVMLMWKNFFDPSPEGILNQLIGVIGLNPQKWLNDKSLAMISILIPQGWMLMGPGCLIYLAALKTVPNELYEASAVDGAGIFKRIRHITLPSIKTLIMIQLIFGVIGAFQAADYVLVMTQGGPDYATNVIGLEIFYNAFVYLKFGVATAMGWILGFILIGFTVFQMRRLSKITFTTAGAKD